MEGEGLYSFIIQLACEEGVFSGTLTHGSYGVTQIRIFSGPAARPCIWMRVTARRSTSARDTILINEPWIDFHTSRLTDLRSRCIFRRLDYDRRI